MNYISWTVSMLLDRDGVGVGVRVGRGDGANDWVEGEWN